MPNTLRKKKTKRKTAIRSTTRPRRKKKTKAKRKVVLATRAAGKARKLTDKLIEECCELILEGLPIERTCDYLGISRAAYYQWKERGERFLNQLHDKSGPDYPEDESYAVFVQAVVRSKAEWQLALLRRSFGEKNKATWVRDMTMMERRDRQNWGRSEVISHVASAPLPDDSYL